ncbi:hypothetical protein [Alicyclobacillus macrosporangiidus]|uniref:Uncharacterized protein n=1 Tax=Alicyclobacillus macrosporangiidus TaxID=392015 RepID=A0A1I7GRP6_9BACL|nr:hypothetical protein [Alicyclobacillus macrosporangiidus]SFU50936.1 hypothetical protein SAMN05421543_10313 [Alicyclobacillus macrosporangiidus]
MHQVVQELQDLQRQMTQVIRQLQQMHQRLQTALGSAQQQQQPQMTGMHTLSRSSGGTIGSGVPAAGSVSDARLGSGVHSYGAAYAPAGPSSTATPGAPGRGVQSGALAGVLRADGHPPATPGRQSEHTVYGRLM